MEVIIGLALIRPELLAVLGGVLLLGPDGFLGAMVAITFAVWCCMMRYAR